MAYTLMSFLVVRIINAPLLFLNMIVNTFYAFCLIFPPQSAPRKQPLTTLLGFLVSCTITYCVSLVVVGTYGVFNEDQQLNFTFTCMVFYFVDYSITSYVWLNFYYCLQIVPSRFALVLWVKRNIKSTIYVILAIDSFVIMLSRLGYYIRNVIYEKYLSSNDLSLNSTILNHMREEVAYLRMISFYVLLVLFSVCSCVMVVSSLSTACYLHGHIKSVSKSGTSFSAKTLRAQIRVTISGICQGVLFFLYASYYLFSGLEFVKEIQHDKYNRIFFTITTLFISGTTVTLGIGQIAFRQRIVNMFKALKRVGTCQKTQ